MKAILLCFLLLLPLLSFGQRSDYFLYQSIAEQLDTTTYTWVNLDSIDKIIIARNQAHLSIDQRSMWHYQFEYTYNWEEVIGRDVPGARGLQLSTVPVKQYANRPVFSSQALIDSCSLHSFIAGKEMISHYPIILQRDAPYNAVWTPILSGDWLVLRFVHSYPDGNMTSFYREVRLYFRRVT